MSLFTQIQPEDAPRYRQSRAYHASRASGQPSRGTRGGRARGGKTNQFRIVEDSPNERPTTARSSTSRFRTLESGRLGQVHAQHDVHIEPPVSGSPPPEDIAALGVPDFDNDNEDFGQGAEVGAAEDEAKEKDSNTIGERMLRFLPYRPAFLDEILRGDGPGTNTTPHACLTCGAGDVKLVKCKDCHGQPMSCVQCLLKKHRSLPLHHVEEWTGTMLKKTTLKELGLRVYLGHNGGICKCPGIRWKAFAVGDLSGFHEVDVTFCCCNDDNDGVVYSWAQLLRVGWFPASTDRPSTAFSIQMLDFYLELNAQAKTNVYDFHKTLARVTDNSGQQKWNLYRQLGDAVRIYRHLMMLKRAGRGHDPDGINATKEGSLAIDCPACPHPSKNLPPDWQDAGAEVQWLYTLFLMTDANFKLKLKDKNIKDIELAPGWAYFVNDEKYKAHLVKHFKENGDIIEENTCSADHNAILKANIAKEGYSVSGVGAVLCARHSLVRPNGVGDLQKGERYVNMDYILLSTLINAVFMALLLTYDIACQYSKKFARRVLAFPPAMQLGSAISRIRHAIPKKHILVHGLGHSRWSLNFLPWVGRTCGEGVESTWSVSNGSSAQTKEMGAGSRHENLDSNWGSWNWRKILDFGPSLSKNLRIALRKAAKHVVNYAQYTASFDPEDIAAWELDIARWKKDPTSKPDPFEEPETHTTMNQIRQELADEDAADLRAGVIVEHEISPAAFLQNGLELEEQQRTFKLRAKNKTTTELQEKRNILTRRIGLWRKAQVVYLPTVTLLVEALAKPSGNNDEDDEDDNSAGPVLAEDLPLYLPSGLPSHLRASALVKPLLTKERKLRLAQAEDALAEIRRLRCVISTISQFRRVNVTPGQRTATRIRSYYDKFQTRIKYNASRYRAARKVLLELDPDGEWQQTLLILRDADIRGPGHLPDDEIEESEGQREVSWIWCLKGVNTGKEHVEGQYREGMRVEWAKSKARLERWQEEVLLLKEEMRRVVAYLEWHGGWWRQQSRQRQEKDGDGLISGGLSMGLVAYAEKQAVIRETLARIFGEQWYPILCAGGEVPAWIAPYKPVNEKARRDRMGRQEVLELNVDGVIDSIEEDDMDVD
ncbi:hypothetical protein EIP91_011184 [Steccherinum ochraceum]|uniref:CxC2-like cysteine cluster KDZ transposase-associated domain-containing protein n=1 Tax=Steccherinum ochraceum TaxID=92696 RepID=A0A4R0R2G4_9APHY|nr:hypothetical protein EIP91_011184 [Steccherinum ochraceum]